VPESAEETYARVVGLVGEHGRLPTPPVEEWDVFPWAGDVTTKVLRPPVAEEPPRSGAPGGEPCWRCEHGTQNAIWADHNWLVTSKPEPGGLPLILFVESRAHLDLMDLDDDLAGEWGRLCNTLHRVMSNLPNVGRVHVCKWGDGSYHFHTWFIARPARFAQIVGSAAVEWDEILPPVPREIWEADRREVARKLATHGGEALV
jgi:hypothetical protein